MMNSATMIDEENPVTALFRSHRSVFLRVLTRRLGDPEIAEEVLQEAFIHFERAAKDAQIDNPPAYFMRIALNLAIDRQRQDASRRTREEAWFKTTAPEKIGMEYASSAVRADDALISAEQTRAIRARLDELSPQVRKAFTLHKIQGLSHADTAAQMGLSRSTVEKHVMKAMRFLMDRMAEIDP